MSLESKIHNVNLFSFEEKIPVPLPVFEDNVPSPTTHVSIQGEKSLTRSLAGKEKEPPPSPKISRPVSLSISSTETSQLQPTVQVQAQYTHQNRSGKKRSIPVAKKPGSMGLNQLVSTPWSDVPPKNPYQLDGMIYIYDENEQLTSYIRVEQWVVYQTRKIHTVDRQQLMSAANPKLPSNAQWTHTSKSMEELWSDLKDPKFQKSIPVHIDFSNKKHEFIVHLSFQIDNPILHSTIFKEVVSEKEENSHEKEKGSGTTPQRVGFVDPKGFRSNLFGVQASGVGPKRKGRPPKRSFVEMISKEVSNSREPSPFETDSKDESKIKSPDSEGERSKLFYVALEKAAQCCTPPKDLPRRTYRYVESIQDGKSHPHPLTQSEAVSCSTFQTRESLPYEFKCEKCLKIHGSGHVSVLVPEVSKPALFERTFKCGCQFGFLSNEITEAAIQPVPGDKKYQKSQVLGRVKRFLLLSSFNPWDVVIPCDLFVSGLVYGRMYKPLMKPIFEKWIKSHFPLLDVNQHCSRCIGLHQQMLTKTNQLSQSNKEQADLKRTQNEAKSGMDVLAHAIAKESLQQKESPKLDRISNVSLNLPERIGSAVPERVGSAVHEKIGSDVPKPSVLKEIANPLKLSIEKSLESTVSMEKEMVDEDLEFKKLKELLLEKKKRNQSVKRQKLLNEMNKLDEEYESLIHS